MKAFGVVLVLVAAFFSTALGAQVCYSCTDGCYSPHADAFCNTLSAGQWNVNGNTTIDAISALECTLAVFGNLDGNQSMTLRMTNCAYLYITENLNPNGAVLEVDMMNKTVDFTSVMDVVSYSNIASNFSEMRVINVVYPVGGGSPRFSQGMVGITLRFYCNASSNCPPIPTPVPPPVHTPPPPVPTPLPFDACLTCETGCPRPHPNASCMDGQWVIYGNTVPGEFDLKLDVGEFTSRVSCPINVKGDLLANSSAVFLLTRCAIVNISGFALTNSANINVDMRSHSVVVEERIKMFYFYGAQNFFGSYTLSNVNLPPGGVDLNIIVNPNDAVLHFSCKPGINCPPAPSAEPPAPDGAVPTPHRSESGIIAVSGILYLSVALLQIGTNARYLFQL